MVNFQKKTEFPQITVDKDFDFASVKIAKAFKKCWLVETSFSIGLV